MTPVEQYLDRRLRSGLCRLGSPELRERVRSLAAASGAARALDVGCGAGELVGLLRESGIAAVGLELSPSLADRARARIGDDAAILEGDAQRLPLPDATVDLVTSMLVLHYLPDPGRALVEAARVLVPGGRLVLADRVASPDATLRLLQHRIETLRNPWIHRLLDDDEIESEIEEAGFRLEDAEAHEEVLPLDLWTTGMSPDARKVLDGVVRRLPRHDLGGLAFEGGGRLRLRMKLFRAVKPA